MVWCHKGFECDKNFVESKLNRLATGNHADVFFGRGILEVLYGPCAFSWGPWGLEKNTKTAMHSVKKRLCDVHVPCFGMFFLNITLNWGLKNQG